MRHWGTFLPAAAALVVASCQDVIMDTRAYPDAVVCLNQVDPIYRPYFAVQNGSNYSLEEQRAAFLKAAQTARGPMPAYTPAASPKKPKAGTAKKPGAKKPVAGKKGSGKASVGKKPVTTGKKPVAKKPATTAKKPAGTAKKPAAKPAAKGKKR